MNLGENIYRLRTEKNMSQGDLADALEVSRQSVSKWENDSAVPELEKLVKMADIFGVSIDELVTGKEKAEPAPPAPPATPSKQGLSTQQILGIILMVFGGLCLIVFTVVGIFVDLLLLGIAIALPFLLCGLICLLCKKNVGLKCAWAVYLPIWFICTVLVVRSHGAMAYIIGGGLLLGGAVLTLITIRHMVNGLISLPRWVKILLSAAMVLGLLVTLAGMLPPLEVQVDNPFVEEHTHIVTPADPTESTVPVQ